MTNSSIRTGLTSVIAQVVLWSGRGWSALHSMISEAMMSWPCDQREEPAPQSSVCSVLCALCYNLCAMLCPLCCLLCIVSCLLCAMFCVLFALFRLCTSCVQAKHDLAPATASYNLTLISHRTPCQLCPSYTGGRLRSVWLCNKCLHAKVIPPRQNVKSVE